MVLSNDYPNSDLLDATVDAVCDQFEAAWLSQQNPRIEDYLSDASESIGQRLVNELLLAEFDLCRRSANHWIMPNISGVFRLRPI